MIVSSSWLCRVLLLNQDVKKLVLIFEQQDHSEKKKHVVIIAPVLGQHYRAIACRHLDSSPLHAANPHLKPPILPFLQFSTTLKHLLEQFVLMVAL